MVQLYSGWHIPDTQAKPESSLELDDDDEKEKRTCT